MDNYSITSLLIFMIWLYWGIYNLGMIRKNQYRFYPQLIPWINLFVLIAGPITLIVVNVCEMLSPIKDYFSGRERERALALENSITLRDSHGGTIFASESNQEAAGEAIHIIKQLIANAIKRHASDIFIDPKQNNIYSVRLRIDGTLREVMTLPEPLAVSAISAIKVAASMDISEHRRPQDGAFSADTKQGNASFRIASVGAFGGEKMTIRVLGAVSGLKTLKDLGLSPENLEIMEHAIKIPSGLILMCGPTGSGKTSTLYALLQSIDYTLKNVISIEDPIENIIPQVSQMEVNTKANITFSSLLRNALRQNPDIICLGEIRDEETAAVAIHAAQTGHLIIATVHSNDNLGTIDRLLSLGIPLRTIAATLHVVVSQRLVRTLCHCKKTAALPEQYQEYFEAAGFSSDKLCVPAGCPDCDGTGYHGRQALFDIMMVNNELKAMFEAEGATLSSIQSVIEESHGSSMMVYEGLKLASQGITTIDEVERVTLNLD